jgi:ABC-type dipeptide/oligopeptide/nickel transport system permease subunit
LTRYLIKRTFGALLVMFAVATPVFFMPRLVPGDPIAAMLFDAGDPDAAEEIRRKLGLGSAEPRRRRKSRFLALIVHDKKAVFGLVVLSVFLISAVFATWLAPSDPNAMSFEMLRPPSWQFPLGTDDLGRDLLSRVIHGTRISLFVGISTVLIALFFGVAPGLAAGYFGGWIDYVIMRYIDLQ